MARCAFASAKLRAERLADSGFSLEWTISKLLEHNPNFVDALGDGRIEKVDVRDISDGKGFASAIYRVVLGIAGGTRPEYSFVMKVPTGHKGKAIVEELCGADTAAVSGQSCAQFYKADMHANKLPSVFDGSCKFT